MNDSDASGNVRDVRNILVSVGRSVLSNSRHILEMLGTLADFRRVFLFT